MTPARRREGNQPVAGFWREGLLDRERVDGRINERGHAFGGQSSFGVEVFGAFRRRVDRCCMVKWYYHDRTGTAIMRAAAFTRRPALRRRRATQAASVVGVLSQQVYSFAPRLSYRRVRMVRCRRLAEYYISVLLYLFTYVCLYVGKISPLIYRDQ